jgi:hypothetical protein
MPIANRSGVPSFEPPTSREGDLVEEADSRHRDTHRTGRELPLLAQMELIGSNVG